MIDTLQRALGNEYRVIRKLGQGGMSTVFLAEDLALGRKVVVKVLAHDLAGTMPRGRFKREIMVAANLQHPHIVGLITAGEADGLPYFIMPFVEGQSLRHMISEKGELPLPEVVAIMRDVARACSYAHARGIVHRDIKPDNVLLSAGVAMLADFGVAKALTWTGKKDSAASDSTQTAVGVSLGTPTYIAPEQAAADPNTDHRADIYSLGATAYEMLAGHPPFEYVTTHELVTAHISEEPRNILELRPEMPVDFARLIMQCLAKNPDERPQGATELVEWLSVSGVVSQPTRNRQVREAMLSRQPSKRSLLQLIGTGVAVAAFVVAGLVVLPRMQGTPVSDNSLAVLPFVNTGGNPENEYFADGMTDELTVTLASLPGLRVASRTAAFAFKNSDASPAEIGDALNVAHLIEGTVRRSDSRVRMTAQLVDAQDGLAVWSESFDREVEDVFAVQEEVARAITDELRRRLAAPVPERPDLIRRGTDNREAYDTFMRARFLMRQRGAGQLREALSLFRRARQMDPGYAPAAAGMADVLGLLPLYTGTRIDSVLGEALSAADAAIAMDSTLAGAWASRGNLRNTAWQWEEARSDLERAVRLDPRFPEARQWLGENLLMNGDFQVALENFKLAAELDPVSPVAAALVGLSASLSGQPDTAEQWAARAIELGPTIPVTHFMAGAVSLYADNLNEARDRFETAALYGRVPALTGLLGYTYARLGMRDRASAELARLRAGGPNTGAAIAKIQIGLGNYDTALAALEAAARQHDSFFSSEPTGSPIFDPVRADARFQRVLDSVGIGH